MLGKLIWRLKAAGTKNSFFCKDWVRWLFSGIVVWGWGIWGITIILFQNTSIIKQVQCSTCLWNSEICHTMPVAILTGTILGSVTTCKSPSQPHRIRSIVSHSLSSETNRKATNYPPQRMLMDIPSYNSINVT